MIPIRFTPLILMFVLSTSLSLSGESHHLPLATTSPDMKVQLIFSLDEYQKPVYSVIYQDQVVIAESYLALELNNGLISEGLTITNVKHTSNDETYNLIVGKSKQARNHYNEMIIELQEKQPVARRLNLIFRVYDDGAAFRYYIPEQKAIEGFEILAEHSEFNFKENHTCWALQLKSFTTNYESKYNQTTLRDINTESLIGLPLTIEINNGPVIAITEANLTDYAGMYLVERSDTSNALVSMLSPLPDNNGVCVRGITPHYSPWRVIMIGDKPGDLIESDIITNLNEPCAISDPSWIKPGKVAWPWWSDRIVKDVDFTGGMNTATQKHYIDFAAEYGLEYLLIDAKWYGPHKDPTQDITTTIPEIDLPHLISFAAERNVDVMLWLNWDNTRDQMDVAFPLYEQWGIKGIKVDYMNSDDQEIVKFYHEVVKKAAEHHLLVNFHGAYKPTGFRRTYPNLITREGVMGLEHTKWSNRITPEHNVTLPFTRMLAGPMDYTPGAFQNVTRNSFEPQYKEPLAMGTRCHHLAMYVVYDSPLQMCSDYPASYRGEAGAEFLKIVPASWDETIVLKGQIGDYVAIARKHDQDWFIGAMTDWDSRKLDLSLDFLDAGKYNCLIYSDGDDAENNPKNIIKERIVVNRSDRLSAQMASGGGYIVHLTPAIEE